MSVVEDIIYSKIRNSLEKMEIIKTTIEGTSKKLNVRWECTGIESMIIMYDPRISFKKDYNKIDMEFDPDAKEEYT